MGVVHNLIAVGLIMIVFVIFASHGLAGLRWPGRKRALRAGALAAAHE